MIPSPKWVLKFSSQASSLSYSLLLRQARVPRSGKRSLTWTGTWWFKLTSVIPIILSLTNMNLKTVGSSHENPENNLFVVIFIKSQDVNKYQARMRVSTPQQNTRLRNKLWDQDSSWVLTWKKNSILEYMYIILTFQILLQAVKEVAANPMVTAWTMRSGLPSGQETSASGASEIRVCRLPEEGKYVGVIWVFILPLSFSLAIWPWQAAQPLWA